MNNRIYIDSYAYVGKRGPKDVEARFETEDLLEEMEWAGIQGAEITAVSTHEFPRPAVRPQNSVLANARLERGGLPLMRDWREAAREYVEGFLKS